MVFWRPDSRHAHEEDEIPAGPRRDGFPAGPGDQKYPRQKKFPAFEIELFDPDVKEDYSKLTQFKKEPMVVHGLKPDSLEGKDLVFLASDAETDMSLGKLAEEGRFKAIDLSETFNARTASRSWSRASTMTS